MEADERLYHATPQTRGRIAHEKVDKKTNYNKKETLQALPVFSEIYGLFGKIDEYHKDTETLIEHKYKLKTIYQGQIYQLWAQMFCLLEMGYQVSKIAFYEMSTNKTIPITLPTLFEKIQFESFIQKYRQYNPIDIIETNPNKCRHCIYCNLCDKTEEENVY